MSRGGTVRKDPATGTYYFVVDTAEPGSPKRRQLKRRFATQREAREALTGVLSEVRAGTFVTPDTTTLATWVEQWAAIVATQVRPSTAHSYARNLRLHAVPTLGARSLQSIRPAHLTALYAELLAGGRRDHRGALSGQGLSLRSVAYVATILGRCLGDAVDGGPYHPDRFSRTFGEQGARLGLPPIRVHDLRHTWATLALEAGVHVKVVSERLGHSGVGITLNVYSHVIPAMESDAADRVAALILGGARELL